MTNRNQIPFNDLSYQTNIIKERFYDGLHDIIDSNGFIHGSFVSKFEKQFSNYLNVINTITVNSGTDALFLAALGLELNQNDKVFIQANTYFATIESFARLNCQIELCDVKADSGQLDLADLEMRISEAQSISPTQRIIVAIVHLFGNCPDMEKLTQLSQEYGFLIIEDAAQAHGSFFGEQRLGSFGLVSSFSFYPGKNLGAFGDGGAVVTNSPNLATKIRALADHGQIIKDSHDFIGINSRLDTIQALSLSLKLEYLDEWNQMRRSLANIYINNLSNCAEVNLLNIHPKCTPNYHLFVIRVSKRDELIRFLNNQGIQCRIHYPLPIHRQKGFYNYHNDHVNFIETDKFCSQIVSLPLYPGLAEDDINHITLMIHKFFREK
jgi:dTDP-4-amino-4,6-dideoxygalactose transaminase